MNNTQDRVFIVDGSSFLYRAYYSMPPLTARDGTTVHAVYGFCRMIKKIMDTYKPEHMVLVWDSKGPTMRHEIYPEYKQTRQAAPSDLGTQKQLIKEFAQLIGLTQLEMPGIEADDLMFSLAKELERNNQKSLLITSDKDLRQVLSEHVHILDPFQEKIITRESAEEKYGFSLDKLPFYFGLIGDTSDNIPGVKGVGPKTAQDLVNQFATMHDLYENLEQVKSERVRKLLQENKESAFLSQDLFTLRPIDTMLTKNCCTVSLANWANARPLFERFNFKTFLKSMGVESAELAAPVDLHKKYTFKMVTHVDELQEACNEIRKLGRCALDTESDGLDPLNCMLVGVSLCAQEGVAYYIPIAHQTGEPQIPAAETLRLLKSVLEDEKIEKYLHHAKFDALMLYGAGINLRGITFDTMIAASLLVADGQRIGLKYLSEYYLQEPMFHFDDVVKKGKYPNFAYVPLALATEYAAADAHQTMRLYNTFKKGLAEVGQLDLFEKLEMPLLNTLYAMEQEGIICDEQVIYSINNTVTEEMQRLHTQIIDIIGHEYANINLNSPKQLEELLFVRMKLPVIKKTAARTSYSTDQEVLRELSKIHPVPALIMRYRELAKLKSTYLDALGHYINPRTKRIHTTFSQTVVATGRLASSEPNLQNIPVDRYHVRSAFKPKEGSLFLSADYSQIELRVLGYLSQDQTLIQAFNEGIDIHALTAAGLFNVPVDQVVSEQRQVAKRINFSILYGLTAHGLSKDLDISHALAKEYIEKFMAQYPGVQAWMESVVAKTKELGYVETLFKRRRYLPGIYEKNKTMYDLARRVAINTVAQGTAAELVKLGMINLEKSLRARNLSSKMLLQIHDELLLEVAISEKDQVHKLVIDTLEHVVVWNVPLVVTTRFGANWQEVTK